MRSTSLLAREAAKAPLPLHEELSTAKAVPVTVPVPLLLGTTFHDCVLVQKTLLAVGEVAVPVKVGMSVAPARREREPPLATTI